jgi:hypothetical protein
MSAASIPPYYVYPLVICGVADLVFATHVSDGLTRFDGFHDGYDFELAEFALSLPGFLASYSPGNLYFQWPGFWGGLQFLSDPF